VLPAATRLIAVDDAPALAELVNESRGFLAPWEPIRPESFFTVAGQREVIEGLLDRRFLGLTSPHVVLTPTGEVAGRITLDGITRGAFQSCGMGYWVAERHNGQGLATLAVAEMVRRAFDDLGLHRVEAGTLVHNARSQRVLEKNGFERYGLAPQLVHIDGRWQDHVMFQRVNAAWTERP
jgi:ribosomal-protein-alanine N-acetyltransferase